VVGVGAGMRGFAGVAEVVEAFVVVLFFGGERHVRWMWLIADFEAVGDVPLMSVG
jgi:hypothetical protein